MSSGSKVPVEQMAKEIMNSLTEYADLATDEMKEAVKDAAKTVRKEIQANAPVNTGAYKKSWTYKKTKETSSAIEYTVHSKDRYQLAHLLEHGHALRNGGRAKAIPHIAPAEETGYKQLETDLKRRLS